MITSVDLIDRSKLNIPKSTDGREALIRFVNEVNSAPTVKAFTAEDVVKACREIIYEKVKQGENGIGAIVKTIKDKDAWGCEVFPVGTIGVILNIEPDSRLPYKIGANNDYWFYSRDMFEFDEQENENDD